MLSVQCEPVSPRCSSGFESSGLACEDPPLGQRGRAAFLVCMAVDEMALEIKMIVDIGKNAIVIVDLIKAIVGLGIQDGIFQYS